jgi:DNA-binding GntR family transcriptional regulator
VRESLFIRIGLETEAMRRPLDRVRRLALPEPGRPEATFAEQLRLVEAVRCGDVEFAASAMRVRLAMVGRRVERERNKMEEAPDRRA